MRTVVWQYMHVMHQSEMLKALADMGHKVISVAEVEMTQQQRSMGYFLPKMEKLKVITNPDENEIKKIIGEKKDESVHIVGGIRGYHLGKRVMDISRRMDARVGWLVEGGDPRGVNGILRRLIYRIQSLQYRNDVDFILAMGKNGVSWYRSCGWPSGRVFPYAYITEAPIIKSNSPYVSKNNCVEIVYVGQLIHRKGVDLLLNALARVSINNWHLTIIGAGPEYQNYYNLAHSLKIDKKCSFLGVMANKEALEIVSNCDLLILPSRFDGWGATTNEALMCGVPVICSNSSGSSDLLRENWRGSVFNNESVDGLSKALNFWILKGKKKSELSHKILQWSHCIEGQAAALYVLSIINQSSKGDALITPPWYPKNFDSSYIKL